MENVMNLLMGFGTVFSPENLGVCLLGSVLGLIVGAMPGIGSLAGCALLLPLTYKFDPTAAIIMLGALYYSNMYGGAFSAILLNVPGDSPAVMTVLDGHPMAEKGQPGQALFTSNLASCIGGLVGMLILTFLGPALAEVGLLFGPAEMTSLMIMSLMSIGWLLGDDPVKGTVSTMVGFLLASIGMDTLSGTPRFEFGNMYLLGGIPFVAFVIGAVGLSQVIDMMATRHDPSQIPHEKLTIKGSLLSAHQLRRMLPPAIRSGFIGTFVGVLPGSGATAASFLCYASQKAFKNEEPLGTGAIEGLSACESGNNAAAAGSFAPLLALGIPGSGTGAVLLGGLMMWGLNPGPLLFTNDPEFAWGLIASLFISNIISLAISLLVIPSLIKILSIPTAYMIPIITVVCLVGSYSTDRSMYNVIITAVFGVVGYFFGKCGLPLAPVLLSFVLAPIFESNMRKAFISSQGSLDIFVTSPISLAFLLVTLLLILSPVIKIALRKAKGGAAKA